MVRLAPERVLLIGDVERELHVALLQAAPGAQVTSVPSVFDAIAELSGSGDAYTTVLAAAAPIARRADAAVRTLRAAAGDGKIVLFGDAGTEPLSRRMLGAGCDDYLLLPAGVAAVRELLAPPMRLAPPAPPASPPASHDAGALGAGSTDAGDLSDFTLPGVPLADVLFDALLNQPHDSLPAAMRQLNARLAPSMEFLYQNDGEQALPPRENVTVLSHVVEVNGAPGGTLHLLVRDDRSESIAQHALAHVARLVGKLATLQDRHNRLQKLAITDELTGVYNARYFRHFLTRILDRARKLHFPVTLLLFDIDDFKKYNDQFGHGVGDEILKQTAAMMKRSTREHDLVARIGGDEFAVVFWDKEGPRQAREPHPGTVAGRPPQSPMQIFRRFKRLIASDEFTALGQSGKGVLGISAGLAVFPYEASDATSLIKEADRALMQGAKKKTGKNCIFIVGTDDPSAVPREAKG